MTKIEADVMGSAVGLKDLERFLLPASEYKIADIFAEVNPREKYFLKSDIYKRDSDTHRKILKAIIEQNEDTAKDLMLEHLTTDYAPYRKALN